MNPLAVDTVVLRDGTVLLGKVTSVTGTGVAINVKGRTTTLQRTRVARVVFGGGTGSSVGKMRPASSRRKK